MEMLAEGYRRLDLAADELERQVYPKRTAARKMAEETAGNLRNAVELMDQTDEAEGVVAGLMQMVEEKRLKVRVYTKGRLHAKAYICDYGEVFDETGKNIDRHEKGIAVVGSSDLTLAGLSHNTELNVVVQGNQNHSALVQWFDDLWKEATEFDEALMHELAESWAAAQVTPYDIYMKTLYALVRDRLEGEEEQELLWDDDIFRKLASFQKVAVRQTVQMIRDFGGAFVSDVVGLGKSYIGAAIVKHFERTDHSRPLIICPAPLREMWERYNEVYQLNARVLSMGYLREDENDGVARLLNDVLYRDRDFVLIDESHNLRHPESQRYKVVQTFLSTGRRCCFLTATPRNKTARDVYHQIKLFHQDDRTDLPVDPPNLKDFFKLIDRGERKLPDLLANILIRRTRNHILRWYGFDAETHESFLKAIDAGFVPAGEEAQSILYESDMLEESDLVDALRQVSKRYYAKDFDTTRLKAHLEHDIEVLRNIRDLVAPITPDKDAKLQVLKERLNERFLRDSKRLVFTQYADTARYLYANLNPDDQYADVEVIFSGDKSKERVVGRFAPKANPEYRFGKGEAELMTVIATDVLAEGLNLQDCDNIINYDLHWNPVRLIQRFGRIDRIGSEHEVIFAYNFLPELGIEKNLGLRQTLHNRIQEIHDTIGEDSFILDESESLNPEAMYAIYETGQDKPAQLDLWEKPEEEFLDLNEAEEILRQMRNDNPDEFERIANLRDGIRTARSESPKGLFVFCQAGRYQQLFLLDEKGEIISRDTQRVVGSVKCGPDTGSVALPDGHNEAVMNVRRVFEEQVKHREAERTHSFNLTHGQLYVLRELRVLFEGTAEEEVRSNINVLEKTFRGTLTGAVKRELNQLRRNGVTGDSLYRNLIRIYDQHSLKDAGGRRILEPEDRPVPRIICSEAFV